MDSLLDQLSVFLERDDSAAPEPATPEPAAPPSNLVPFPQPVPHPTNVPQPQDIQALPLSPPAVVLATETTATSQVSTPEQQFTPNVSTPDLLTPNSLTPNHAAVLEQSITELLNILAPAERRETTLNALQQLIVLLGAEPALADSPLTQHLTQDLEILSTQQQEMRSHLDRLAARIEQISQLTTQHHTLLANVQPETVQSESIQPETVQSASVHPESVQPETVQTESPQPESPQSESSDPEQTTFLAPTPIPSNPSPSAVAAAASSLLAMGIQAAPAESSETKPEQPEHLEQSDADGTPDANSLPVQSNDESTPVPASNPVLTSPDLEAMTAMFALAESVSESAPEPQQTSPLVSPEMNPIAAIAPESPIPDTAPVASPPPTLELENPETDSSVGAEPGDTASVTTEPTQTEPTQTPAADIASTAIELAQVGAIAPQLAPNPTSPDRETSPTTAMPNATSVASALAAPEAVATSSPPNNPTHPEPTTAFSTLQSLNPELTNEFQFVQTKVEPTATPTSLWARLRPRRRSVALGLGVVALVVLPWGGYRWFVHPQRVLETQLAHTFAADPQLAIYRLDAAVKRNQIELSGILPSQQLRDHAKDVVRELAPNLKLRDETIVVDSTVIQAVQQMSQTLNQMSGIDLETTFVEGTVTLTGTTIYPNGREDLTSAFAQLPGVETVENKVQLQPLSIATRIYFAHNTTELRDGDEAAKIQPLVTLLKENPQLQIRIVGYGHSSESNPSAIALDRAQAIQTRLEDQGIDRGRLQVASQTQNPPGMAKEGDRWLGRCVLFEVAEPAS